MMLAISNEIIAATFSDIINAIILSKKIRLIAYVLINIAANIGKTIITGLIMGKYSNFRNLDDSNLDF